MAKWQDRLKDNESKMKALTTSQQNLATTALQAESKSTNIEMTKSTPAPAASTVQPFAAKDDGQSLPPELQKVKLHVLHMLWVTVICFKFD